MEVDHTTQCFSFIRKVLVVLGVWHDGKPWNFFRVLYFLCLQILFCICQTLSTIFYSTVSSELVDMTESLYMGLSEAMFFVKTINLVVMRQSLNNFVEKANTPFLASLKDEEIQVVRRSNKRFNRIRNTFLGLCYTCTCFGFLTSAVSQRQRLPFPGWLPFDWKNSDFYFWLGFTYQAFAMNFTVMLNIAYGLLNGYVIFQVSLFFRLISMRLESIGWESENGNGENVERQIIDCIRMHQFVTSMVVDAGELISMPLFLQLNACAVVLCFTAFELTLISPIDNATQFFTYCVFIICILMEILMPCYYGSELFIQTDHLVTAMYSSNWTEQNLKYKKLIYYFMERLKTPIVVKGGRFFVISLGVMLSVIKSGYSLFALVINLKN